MNKTTILIVEDEGIVAENLASKLTHLGYEVAGITAGGQAAIEMVGRLCPNLVLMDIWLEGPMDGIEVAEAVRRQYDVPVIYLTAYSDPATLDRAKVTGPFGYILKPFEERELATQIELALYKHRADREVRRQREWLRVTLTSIGDAVIATDAQGIVTFVNPVAESLTGWKTEEGVGQPLQVVFRVINEETGEPLEDPVVRVLREGRPVALANHAALVTKDGRTVPIEDSAAPILDTSGQMVGVVLVFHDVTARRRAAEAVQEGRQRLAGIVGSAMDAIISVDTDQRIVLFNAAAEKMFGCPAAAATGQTLGQFIPERFRTAHAQHVRMFGQNGATSRSMGRLGSLIGLRADGDEFPIEASISQVEVGGQKVFTVIIRDITERKRAEDELKRVTSVAEAANEAKTRFLANMSHELRTPMNAILGMVDLALPKQVDLAATDCLRTAKESADLLLVLLNDLLDCAKIESGKLELESKPFGLRHALDHITRVLTLRASEKGIRYSCNIAAQVPDALVGDQVRLQQILLHLGGNGIKFTERGEVVVSIAAENHVADEAVLTFSVRDTGIGIATAELEQLIRPFVQADSSTTRRFGGAGVGLSIAASLVAKMGGRLSAESEPGQGSTFHFTVRLPLARQPLPATDVPRLPLLASLKILLVEDNPANQKLAVYVLEGRGHTIDIAEDGQQGLRKAKENHYDVILMDVQMPVMDGLEATKAIRAWENGHGHVPIIAVTAHAMEEDRQRCLAAGMDGYLPKPINAQELFAILERLASGPAPASPPIPTEPRIAPTVLVFDSALALKRCMGSQEMLAEMIQCFYDETDSMFSQINAALQAGDLVHVGRLGHRLKGTVVYLGAEPATEAAQRVAYFSQHPGELAVVEEAVNSLERECEVLKQALYDHRPPTLRAEGH